MKRFKKGCRAIAFMVLMALASVSMTGCDAAAALAAIQKILPVITQVISAVKGIVDGFKGTDTATASGTTTLASATTALSTTNTTATTGTVNEGDDAESIPNSDKE